MIKEGLLSGLLALLIVAYCILSLPERQLTSKMPKSSKPIPKNEIIGQIEIQSEWRSERSEKLRLKLNPTGAERFRGECERNGFSSESIKIFGTKFLDSSKIIYLKL